MSRITHRARNAAEPRSKRKRSPAGHHSDSDGDHDRDNNSDAPTKKQATERRQQVGHDEQVSQMTPALLAEHMAKTLQRHAPESSTLELEGQFIPARALRDTSDFNGRRVSKHLPDFLEYMAGGAEQLSHVDAVASPHTIVITVSGIRAADLTRELRSFATDDCKIAKLFAKHMKLKSTIDFVQRTKIGIGVGTPTRLKELIEEDALQVAALKRIVVDGSYRDEKQRSIFDMKEIYLPTLELLNAEKVRSQIDCETGGIEIAVF